MEVEELRINNLVWDNYSGEMIVREIQLLKSPSTGGSDSYWIGLSKTHDLPIGKYMIDSIEPIPITKELLEKSGFKCVFISYGYSATIINDFGVFNLWKGNNWDHWTFQMGGYDAEDNDFSVEIKYVHQLQNLYFALTGSELTQQPQTPKQS